jgi:hypothetical protein
MTLDRSPETDNSPTFSQLEGPDDPVNSQVLQSVKKPIVLVPLIEILSTLVPSQLKRLKTPLYENHVGFIERLLTSVVELNQLLVQEPFDAALKTAIIDALAEHPCDLDWF